MENQNQEKPNDVKVRQGGEGGLPEPASPQPPEPAGPQPPEPVKSQTTKLQETVDRNLAERAARQKLTEEVVGKRKQTAALEAKAAAVQAENEAVPVVAPTEPAESCTGLPEAELSQAGKDATEMILAEVFEKSGARELREIEMHNTTIDCLKEVTAQTQATVDLLSDIAGSMKDIADSLKAMVVAAEVRDTLDEQQH